MILWTIQTENAWREFQSTGVLRGTRKRIMEQVWDSPYQWMIRQMEQRIAPPPTPGAYPVWAWMQWENTKRPKPDLRARGHLPKCESGIRIEFECPDSFALLSDFDLWHFVLNYWYLPESEVEGDEFEARLAERRTGVLVFRDQTIAESRISRHNRRELGQDIRSRLVGK